MSKPRRHYVTVGNLDLRMLKRQYARLSRLSVEWAKNNPKQVRRLLLLDHHDFKALEGTLNLLAAMHSGAKVSVMPREGGPVNG